MNETPLEKQEIKKEYLNWENFDGTIKKLAQEIKESFSPDVIIALFRGGSIPATYLSHLLGVRDMRPLQIKRTKSDGPEAQMIKPEVKYAELLDEIAGKKILIVDDIADYGESLKTAQEEIAKHNPSEIKTAVLVVHSEHLDQSENKPQIDFIGEETNQWVVFPWEKKN